VPTCSEYAIQAIKTHGVMKGIWLGTKRISKCHPWGTHGYDPVPPKNQKIIIIDKIDFKKIK
jgi:putative membrane protein insertion efficiency factor